MSLDDIKYFRCFYVFRNESKSEIGKFLRFGENYGKCFMSFRYICDISTSNILTVSDNLKNKIGYQYIGDVVCDFENVEYLDSAYGDIELYCVSITNDLKIQLGIIVTIDRDYLRKKDSMYICNFQGKKIIIFLALDVNYCPFMNIVSTIFKDLEKVEK